MRNQNPQSAAEQTKETQTALLQHVLVCGCLLTDVSDVVKKLKQPLPY